MADDTPLSAQELTSPELKGWRLGAANGATATNHNLQRFLATVESQAERIAELEAALGAVAINQTPLDVAPDAAYHVDGTGEVFS